MTEWISVNNHTPEPITAHGRTLYPHVIIYQPEFHNVSVGFYKDPIWYEGIDTSHPIDIGSIAEPTHWAHLPEPPIHDPT